MFNYFLSILSFEGSIKFYLWKINFNFLLNFFSGLCYINHICCAWGTWRKRERMVIRAGIFGEGLRKAMLRAMNCHSNQDLATLWISVLGLHSNKAINSQTRLGHTTKLSCESGKDTSSYQIGSIRVRTCKTKVAGENNLNTLYVSMALSKT